MLVKFLTGIFLGALGAGQLQAATWYVDSSVSSSGNGQSWGTAWKNISNITGVSAGDIVYISGGPSGSSQTYAVSNWTPAGGTAGNPITYKIGQDSAHNGTAWFNSSATYWLGTSLNNIVISGDAGDGKLHFSLCDPTTTNTSGYSAICSLGTTTPSTGFRLSYVLAGNMAGDGQSIIHLLDITGLCEIDHTYIHATGTSLDHLAHFNGSPNAGGYDQKLLVHDNRWYTYQNSGTGIGSDGIQAEVGGASYWNNWIESIIQSGSYNSQHADGMQLFFDQNYVKVYNNTIIGYINSCIYGDNFGSQQHWQINNNVIIKSTAGDGGIVFGPDTSGNTTFNDVIIVNNTVDCPGGGAISFNNVQSSGTHTFTACLSANNVIIGGGSTYAGNPGTPVIDEKVLTTGQGASYFVNYSAGSPNSDFHLKSTATTLIGQGTNLSSYFTTDKDNNSRPGSGAWDVGAYSNGGGGGGNPVISVSPGSLDFGAVVATTGTNLNLTVKNTGGGTLTGSASASTPFQIVSGGSYSLGANQSQTVTVRFNPLAAGVRSQTVSFTGGNGASVSVSGLAYTVLATLSGTAISATFNSIAGVVVPPFIANGTYISQPVTTALLGSGEAIYGFSVANAGPYVVAAQVNAPDTSANSFYVNIDAEPTDPTMIWDTPMTSGFALQMVSWRGSGTSTANQFVPATFNLSAGPHMLIIRGKEAGTQLGPITISIPPPTPRIVSP